MEATTEMTSKMTHTNRKNHSLRVLAVCVLGCYNSCRWVFLLHVHAIPEAQQRHVGIPVIDLSSWTTTTATSITKNNDASDIERRQLVAKHIGKACEDVGFFIVTNHGVNQTILTKAMEIFKEFFDLSLSEKLAYQTNNEAEYPYGYEQHEQLALGKEKDRRSDTRHNSSASSLERSLPDLKETFSIGPSNPQSGMPSRRYPSLPGMKDALEECYSEMEKLSFLLLKIFAVALGLPQDWFEDKIDRHLSALRALNYPMLPNLHKQQSMDGNNTSPVVIRAAAHTDYGAVSILKSGGPGLQARKDNNQGDWMDVPDMPDALIINLGDMMQRWTNDRWISTLHRVVLPTSVDGSHARRQSIAFFVNVNGDTIITPLPSCVDTENPAKYDPITSREHLMAKHLASMGQSNTEDWKKEL